MMPDIVNIPIAAGVLVVTRISAFAMFAPFLGHAAVPNRIKAGVVLVLTVLLYPAWAHHPSTAVTVPWIWSIAGELLVGVSMGLIANLLFESVQMAGQIVGVQMGFSLANIIDPQSQVDTPVVSVFFQLITLLIFLEMDIVHWLLRGLADSLVHLPPGRLALGSDIAGSVSILLGTIFVAGLQIAMPVMVATIVADIVLGFISKASPHFPAMLFGVSIKTIVGLFVLHAAIRYWPALFEKKFGAAVAICNRVVFSAR